MNTFIGVVLTTSVIGTIVYLLSGNWKKALVVVGSWGLYDSLGILYDYVLWPVVQNTYGDISVVYLTTGAMIINFLVLNWYQASGNDWLGVNYLEQIKAKGHKWADRVCQHKKGLIKVLVYVPVKIFQLLVWLLNKNDILAFLLLSIWKDSFVTTAFLRHGRFGKLEKRDYLIFIPSTIVGCLVWGGVIKFGLLAIKAAGRVMFG